MHTLNSCRGIVEGGMIRDEIKNKLWKTLDKSGIICNFNYCHIYNDANGDSRRVRYDLIGNDFLVKLGRWEHWEKWLDDLLAENQIAGMKYKILVCYENSQSIRDIMTRERRLISRICRSKGVSLISANQQGFDKLAESILTKIPYATKVG